MPEVNDTKVAVEFRSEEERVEARGAVFKKEPAWLILKPDK